MDVGDTYQPSGRMKALRAHARGGPEQLVYEDAPVPGVPGTGEVCVRVRAAAITADELDWPETWEVGGVDRTPVIPSHEFSGVVVAVGPDVRDVAVGDEVFGLVPFDRDGAAAEYVIVPEGTIAPRPAEVPDATAAAAVLPALTAMEALDDHLRIDSGQRLLVRGGTGAVGAFVVQFAHRRGISVTSTVRAPESVPRAQGFGADAVLVGAEPESIEPGSFDAAIDAAGAGTPEWLYRAVRAGGRVITLQELPDAELAERFGVDAQFFVVTTRAESLRRLAEAMAGGEVEIPLGRTYPLADGQQAYADRARPGQPGKTVLEPPYPRWDSNPD